MSLQSSQPVSDRLASTSIEREIDGPPIGPIGYRTEGIVDDLHGYFLRHFAPDLSVHRIPPWGLSVS